MEIHDLVHNDFSPSVLRPYVCDEDFCNKAFARKSDLVRHTRIHTNERPWICDWPGCTRSFIQNSARIVHRRVHTGEKPHECEYSGCDKAFSDSSSLARHRRIHTGKRPYKCPDVECGRTFCRKTTLTKHISRYHPTSPAFSHGSWDSTIAQLPPLGDSCSPSPTLCRDDDDEHDELESQSEEKTPRQPARKSASPYPTPPASTYRLRGKGKDSGTRSGVDMVSSPSAGAWSASSQFEALRQHVENTTSADRAYLTPPPQHSYRFGTAGEYRSSEAQVAKCDATHPSHRTPSPSPMRRQGSSHLITPSPTVYRGSPSAASSLDHDGDSSMHDGSKFDAVDETHRASPPSLRGAYTFHQPPPPSRHVYRLWPSLAELSTGSIPSSSGPSFGFPSFVPPSSSVSSNSILAGPPAMKRCLSSSAAQPYLSSSSLHQPLYSSPLYHSSSSSSSTTCPTSSSSTSGLALPPRGRRASSVGFSGEYGSGLGLGLGLGAPLDFVTSDRDRDRERERERERSDAVDHKDNRRFGGSSSGTLSWDPSASGIGGTSSFRRLSEMHQLAPAFEDFISRSSDSASASAGYVDESEREWERRGSYSSYTTRLLDRMDREAELRQYVD